MKTKQQLQTQAAACATYDSLCAWDEANIRIIRKRFDALPRTKQNKAQREQALNILNEISTQRYDQLIRR